MFNLWSVVHFLQWFVIGRFLLRNWYVFLVLSIGWELLELVLPHEFARESTVNKLGDVGVNCLGFYLGNLSKTWPLRIERN